LFIANAFTPNNDGVNDLFRVRVQNDYNISSFHLMVFDRWGTVMYDSYTLSMGWDGTFNNLPCDVGTYFWSLTYDYTDTNTLESVTNTLKGDVTLIR
jgi:gliding motility-associated-like protein